LALRLRALAILLPAVARRFIWTCPTGECPIVGAQRSLWVEVKSTYAWPMSALGQKQTSDRRPLMSAIHPKADMALSMIVMSAKCQKQTF